MYKITKDNKPLDPKLYTIDEANQAFISKENDLVIDFTGESGWIFRIRNNCTITTGNHCIIDAYSNCTITTGRSCFINTSHNCTITTEDYCSINTHQDCTITVSDRCTIDTGNGCNITTGDRAVVVTSENSTITGGENCVVIRHYTSEVIKLIAGQTIRLNGYRTGGYEVVEPIETIEIGGLKFNKEEVEDFLKNLKQIN